MARLQCALTALCAAAALASPAPQEAAGYDYKPPAAAYLPPPAQPPAGEGAPDGQQVDGGTSASGGDPAGHSDADSALLGLVLLGGGAAGESAADAELLSNSLAQDAAFPAADAGGAAAGEAGDAAAAGEAGDAAGGDAAAGGDSGASPEGQYDDGKYDPSSPEGQYDDGKYDPSKYNNQEDGRYEPWDGQFTPIEDFDFSYAVKDEPSGNDYAVQESNKGGAYRILLPDGRYQIVQYVIDGRGIYRQKITYQRADDVQP